MILTYDNNDASAEAYYENEKESQKKYSEESDTQSNSEPRNVMMSFNFNNIFTTW